MRILALITLLVVAPACWAENPLFGLATETAATSTEVTTGASSGAPGTATVSGGEGGSAGSSGGERTSSSGEPTSSNGEPGTTTSTTSTGEPGSSSGATTLPVGTTGDPTLPVGTTTGDAPDLCADPPINDNLHVEVQKDGIPYAECAGMEQKEFEGLLYMNGTEMKLKLTKFCKVVDPVPLVLMSGFNIPMMAGPVCARVTIDWDPEGVDCKLGLLQVHSVEPDKLLYVGAFRLEPDVGFPLHTMDMNVKACDCRADVPGCCDPEPGVIELIPTGGDPVAQYGEGDAEENGVFYKFYNFQSWIGIDPECEQGGSTSRHIDWLAVVEGG